MILYYAIGGGLGHLTRARAVIHTLGLGPDVAIMTASRFANDRRVMAGLLPVEVRPELAGDRHSYNNWLHSTIERLAPEAIYIDAFPAGILGELCAFGFPGSLPLFHIARLLRWEPYRAVLAGPPPRFERTYVAEPLVPEHEQFLHGCSRSIVPLELRDPPSTLPPALEARIRAIASTASSLWIVLHSGPAAEVRQLLDYTDYMASEERAEPQIILVSQSPPRELPPRIIHLDLYPAESLLPYAARIITGCGFNAMRQAAPYATRHRFLPFPRHYDDQHLRAARHAG